MAKIHITVHDPSHKLHDLHSINTSSLCNEYCISHSQRHLPRKLKDKDCVCHFCYAERSEKRWYDLEEALIRNSKLFSKPMNDFPFLNYAYIRFHSFGELINETHMENFYKLAKRNHHVTFCLFTKRYDLVMKFPKLKNMIYIASAPMLNTPITDKEVLDYFDKQFVVYTKEYSQLNNTKITCGVSGGCVNCMQCFKRTGSKLITELLK